jgi:hypothetical protein
MKAHISVSKEMESVGIEICDINKKNVSKLKNSM